MDDLVSVNNVLEEVPVAVQNFLNVRIATALGNLLGFYVARLVYVAQGQADVVHLLLTLILVQAKMHQLKE